MEGRNIIAQSKLAMSMSWPYHHHRMHAVSDLDHIKDWVREKGQDKKPRKLPSISC
jgi:hypothetical protein